MDNRSAESIKTDLKRIFTKMSDLGLELPSLLEPGLSRQEILAVFNSLGLTPPEDVIEFYEFSNGADSDGIRTGDQIDFYDGCHIMSLHTAVAGYRMYMDMLERTESYAKNFSPSYFPFLESGYGIDYLIDFEAERTGKPSILSKDKVLGTDIEFNSLCSMILTMAESFEQGAYTVEEVEEESEDDDTSESDAIFRTYKSVNHDTPGSKVIFRKYNPDVPNIRKVLSQVRFNFGSVTHASDDRNLEDIPLLRPHFTKGTLGPKADLYMVSYTDAERGDQVYQVSIIVPQTDGLPPVVYINWPPTRLRLSKEQMMDGAVRDVQEHYQITVDVHSPESMTWRENIPQYLTMLKRL